MNFRAEKKRSCVCVCVCMSVSLCVKLYVASKYNKTLRSEKFCNCVQETCMSKYPWVTSCIKISSCDNTHTFPVVQAPSPSSPLYLQALMPTPEDQADTIASRKLTSERDSSAGSSQSDSQEGNSNDSSGDGAVSSLTLPEPYENPFLKPAKRIKLKPL